MVFTFDTTALLQSVSDAVTSLSPLFVVTAGLSIAGGVLAWGIGLLKIWRER